MQFQCLLRSSAGFEITENSRDFSPFPSKSPKVQSTTNLFMHSFLSYPLPYRTSESEPFSSDRVRPPLHPSNPLPFTQSFLSYPLSYLTASYGMASACSFSVPVTIFAAHPTPSESPPLHLPPPSDHPCSHVCPPSC